MKPRYLSPIGPLIAVAIFLTSCAPQREFVRFGDSGTFHPGPARDNERHFNSPAGEYDSYELVDHGGAPNHGIPPMYSGQGGGYPVDAYDPYGPPQTIIVPNPW